MTPIMLSAAAIELTLSLFIKVLVVEWLCPLKLLLNPLQVLFMLLTATKYFGDETLTIGTSFLVHQIVDGVPVAFSVLILCLNELAVHMQLHTWRVGLIDKVLGALSLRFVFSFDSFLIHKPIHLVCKLRFQLFRRDHLEFLFIQILYGCTICNDSVPPATTVGQREILLRILWAVVHQWVTE